MSDADMIGAPAVPGIEKLADVPAEGHVRWAITHRSRCAPSAEAAAILIHFAITPALAEFVSAVVYDQSRGPTAVAEVTGWRRGSGGAVIVEYAAVDGHDYELHFDLTGDGRLQVPLFQRALGGIEIQAFRPRDLPGPERAALFDVFDATYEAPDHDYLRHQLEGFDGVALARDRGRVVGFTITDIRRLDLPVIGPQVCSRAGLSCVLPEARRGGVMFSMASAALTRSLLEEGHSGFSLAVSRFATPASFNLVLRRHEGRPWPPADDPFALYDHPTSTQVAVARTVAADFGATGYDHATGACIGTGKPIGTPLVEPEVAPEVVERFEALDRERGDSLLWMSWFTPPPDAWFT